MDDKWPLGAPVIRTEDKNVSQEEQERKSKQAAEVDMRAREAEAEHWRKEHSVMPPPRPNRITGMFIGEYHFAHRLSVHQQLATTTKNLRKMGLRVKKLGMLCICCT